MTLSEGVFCVELWGFRIRSHSASVRRLPMLNRDKEMSITGSL
jgi:hypothetical protein